MSKAATLINKCRSINEANNTINTDDLSVPEIEAAFTKIVKSKYPNSKFKLKMENNVLGAEEEDKDRLLATLDMDTGKIDILGD